MARLNIGSGLKNRVGYVNVDVRKEGNPDIVADISKFGDDDFKVGEFEEILAFDVIEHISFVECKKLLRQCWNWLQPNGTLQLHTQNMRFLASVLAEDDNVEVLRWIYGSLGEGDTNYEGGFHRWGYTKTGLTKLLENMGFKVIVAVEDCQGYGLMVTAVKK